VTGGKDPPPKQSARCLVMRKSCAAPCRRRRLRARTNRQIRWRCHRVFGSQIPARSRPVVLAENFVKGCAFYRLAAWLSSEAVALPVRVLLVEITGSALVQPRSYATTRKHSHSFLCFGEGVSEHTGERWLSSSLSAAGSVESPGLLSTAGVLTRETVSR
jgi:hypothetical protein